MNRSLFTQSLTEFVGLNDPRTLGLSEFYKDLYVLLEEILVSISIADLYRPSMGNPIHLLDFSGETKLACHTCVIFV